MRKAKMKAGPAVLLSLLLVAVAFPGRAEGGFAFNAAKKSLARRIFSSGFSLKKMSPGARYGKGVYLARTKATALKEKPSANAINVFKYPQALEKKAIDTTRMSNTELKNFAGSKDLRGNIHKGIIGPGLGHKLGKEAAIRNKAIIYRSAKDPGHKNIFIPGTYYANKPGIITRERLIEYGR